MLVLSILVFVAVTLAAASLYLFLAPSRAQERIRQLAPEAAPPATSWHETAQRLAGPLARLSLPSGDWDQSHLRLQLLQAGLRSDSARLWYLAAKTALPVLLGAAALGVVQAHGDLNATKQLFAVACAALAGVYLPNAVVSALRR